MLQPSGVVLVCCGFGGKGGWPVAAMRDAAGAASEVGACCWCVWCASSAGLSYPSKVTLSMSPCGVLAWCSSARSSWLATWMFWSSRVASFRNWMVS
eukprot:5289678-Amphidinium_carterae.1